MARASNARGVTRRRFLRDGAVLTAAGTLGAALPAVARSASGGAPTAAVLGGGVAGLTAAHELAEQGFGVTVLERKALGGKARSIPVPGTGNGGRLDLPAEHGFRAEFGFYQNLPDTMRRIPFPGNADGVLGNVVPVGQARLARADDADLTAPLDFEGIQHTTPEQVWMSIFAALREAREIPPDQIAFFARQVAIFFTSCDARRFGQWEYMNWWDYTRAPEMSQEYQKQFADGLTRNLAAAKPRDMSVNSTGIVGESFAYSLTGRSDDPEGAADRVLNAPTNESWIDPWVSYLRGLGVEFRVGETVEGLRLDAGRVAAARVRDARGAIREVGADWFVSAMPVERALGMLDPTVAAAAGIDLERLGRLRTEWMNGVIFHLDRQVPVCHGHVNYIDSQWALTSISQAQIWERDIPAQYGDGRARESFSTIISDWITPGMVYDKPASALPPDKVAHEVWEQLKAHLNDDSNPMLSDDMIVSSFVDTAIQYPAELAGQERIATNDEPLLINTPGSWDDRPDTTTGIGNLVLAGDYVRCTMNVATMESACETGRKAARAVLEAAGTGTATVFDRWTPPENEPLKRLDEQRYRLGLPHVLDTPWVWDLARRQLGLAAA